MKKSQSQINLNAPEKLDFQAKWRSNLKKALRFNLWLLLIFAVLHIGANIYASVLLNRELSIAREKGEPLSLSAMRPKVSEAQNAAPLYRQAYQARNFKATEQNEIENMTGLTADFATRRPQILARNAQVFALLRQAAARPACSFDETWTQSIYSTGPKYYAEMRSLARLMRAQATQEARDGDSAAALRDVRVMFQMADHLKNEPVLIGFLDARSVAGMANGTLAEVLEIQPLPAAQLRAFEASLPATDWDAAFQRSMLGERATALGAFDLSAMRAAAPETQSAQNSWGATLFSWVVAPFMKMNEFYYLRSWRQQNASLQPLPTPLPTLPSPDEVEKKLVADVPSYAHFALIMLPVYARTAENRYRAVVMNHQRQNAFAISAYHAAHGTYPTTLQEAATAWNAPLLPDPYNGKPFGYRSDGQTFILYSVGPNRADDKGRNAQRERGARLKNLSPTNGDDMVWNFKTDTTF